MGTLSRRQLLNGSLGLAGLGLLTGCGALLSRHQESAKIPRIGFLGPGAPEPPLDPDIEAFRQGVQELGYLLGQNIVLEYRWAEEQDDRFPALAADLVNIPVDVILAGNAPAAEAAKRVTETIPIVMAGAGDPVGSGLVLTIARPVGNVTGLSLFDTQLSDKRVELLQLVVPQLTRIAVLWGPDDRGMNISLRQTRSAGDRLGLQVRDFQIRRPDDMPAVFEQITSFDSQALVVTAQPFMLGHRRQIVDLAAKHRLPAMYTLRPFVDAGGLMAYGASLADSFRRAATYVDKILKGAKPADLPVEQPTKFDFVINLSTARALGLTLSQSVLMQATEVIQ